MGSAEEAPTTEPQTSRRSERINTANGSPRSRTQRECEELAQNEVTEWSKNEENERSMK